MIRRRERPRCTWRFRLIAVHVLLAVRLLRLRIRSRGVHHVPRHGGAVLTFSHNGHLDLILTMVPVYRRVGRSCRFLALRDLWDSRGFALLAWLADAIPVERTRQAGPAPARRPLGAAVAALRDGDLVMVAPEGRISRSFELLELRTGAVRMAQQAGVPVVPSVSWGAHRISTTGHGFRWRQAVGVPVEVRFGPPLLVGPEDDVEVATRQLEARMRALLDDAQRDYPDGLPRGAWWVLARLGGGAPPPP